MSIYFSESMYVYMCVFICPALPKKWLRCPAKTPSDEESSEAIINRQRRHSFDTITCNARHAIFSESVII